MIELPKEIKRIRAKTKYQYIINEGEEDEVLLFIAPNSNERSENSEVIIEESKEFINGYKVVKISNGQYGYKYGYISKETGILLPYRYDIACDFNEYGLAMVAKNGCVTWIDKNFHYLLQHFDDLDNSGIMVPEEKDELFNGFKTISAFSQGSVPLSRVGIGISVSYLDTDGNIKEFFPCENDKQGRLQLKYSQSIFSSGEEFNELDYAQNTYGILHVSGFEFSYKFLAEKFIQGITIEQILADATKSLTPPLMKQLLRPDNNPKKT